MKQERLVLLVPPETPVKLAPPGRLAKAVLQELQDRQALREIQELPELRGKRVSRVEPEPPVGPRDGYPEHQGTRPRPIAHSVVSGQDPNTNRIRDELKHSHSVLRHGQHARPQVGRAEIVHRALHGETVQGVLKAWHDEACRDGQECHREQ